MIKLKFAIIPVSLLSAEFKDNFNKAGKLDSFFFIFVHKNFFCNSRTTQHVKLKKSLDVEILHLSNHLKQLKLENL